MATRGTIRDVFYNELVASVSGLVAAGDVDLMEDADSEVLPQVVYDDDYRTLPINRAGAGPATVERDINGDVTNDVHHEHVEAQFTVQVRAGNEIDKEPIYEAVHSAFHKYQFGSWDPRDLNPDLWGIRVQDSRSTDESSPENTIRADTVEVFFQFTRDYKHSTDNIDQVNRDTEGQNSTTN